MIPDNVTLIVKAPNQQIEDQNVECETSWTVRQLKGYLSEVYPSKPRTEEQKIIYSGQLLDDNTILKDVLRTYESQIQHTMHLVCTPNRRMPDPVPKPAETNEGLRRRNVPNEPTEAPRAETRQNDQNHSVEMQNYLSSVLNNYGRVPPYPNYNMPVGESYLPVANDPAAMQMMMIQQAYVQYMQQYNIWQNSLATPPPAPEPPQPEPIPEEEEGRDWLDHLYAASRLAILSLLVYLYGSGARLLLVLILAGAIYLHQIGFFRDLNLNPANQQNQNQNQANANQANANQANANQANANQANANQANVNQANSPAGPTQEIVEQNQQSILAVTWMIFTSFFTSLIPEAQQ